MRDKLKWAEGKPLFGMRVLVTRAREQAAEMVEALEELGAEAVELPTIKIAPPESFEGLDRAISEIAQPSASLALSPSTPLRMDSVEGSPEPRASSYDWIVFTSANGVEAFFQRLQALGKDVSILKDVRLAAIGPATARKLQERGLLIDYVPEEYVAEAVIEGFKNLGVTSQRILIPRAEVAREILPEELEKLGARVDVAVAYRTVPDPARAGELRRLLLEGKIDIIAFTSSSTVKNLIKALEGQDLQVLLEKVRIACIGPVTTRTAGESGLKVDVTAKDYTIPGLVEAIVRMVGGKEKPIQDA